MTVSCLMPTRNRRQFVARAVAMFLEQDWPSKELIAIEDGEPCGDLLRGEPMVRHMRVEGSIGVKLNAGIGAARGDLCVRWDDDDWQRPDRIRRQMDHMRLCGRPVVGFSSLVYYREGDTAGYQYSGEASYASGSTLAFERWYGLAHPFPDKSLGEDGDFAREAYDRGALSTLSGMTCLVAANHDANTRAGALEIGSEAWRKTYLHPYCDSWREVAYREFAATVARWTRIYF